MFRHDNSVASIEVKIKVVLLGVGRGGIVGSGIGGVVGGVASTCLANRDFPIHTLPVRMTPTQSLVERRP